MALKCSKYINVNYCKLLHSTGIHRVFHEGKHHEVHLKENMFPTVSVSFCRSKQLRDLASIRHHLHLGALEGHGISAKVEVPRPHLSHFRGFCAGGNLFLDASSSIRIQLHLHEVEPPFSICCLHDVGCRQLHRFWSSRFRRSCRNDLQGIQNFLPFIRGDGSQELSDLLLGGCAQIQPGTGDGGHGSRGSGGGTPQLRWPRCLAGICRFCRWLAIRISIRKGRKGQCSESRQQLVFKRCILMTAGLKFQKLQPQRKSRETINEFELRSAPFLQPTAQGP